MMKKLFGLALALVTFVCLTNTAHASYISFYDENGGTKIGYMEHVHDTVTITVAAPTRAGYEFTGWASTNSNVTFGDGTLTLPWGSGDPRNNTPINVYATWEVAYNINYDLDGGDVTGNPATYISSKGATIADPTKDGYEFLGWVEAGVDLGKGLTIEQGTTGDKNLVAAWKENAAIVNNPQTGDTIIISLSLMLAGIITLVIVNLFTKKAVKSN